MAYSLIFGHFSHIFYQRQIIRTISFKSLRFNTGYPSVRFQTPFLTFAPDCMTLYKFRTFTFVFFLLISSCKKDAQFLSGSGTLEFTTDTVFFDTVFTRLPDVPYPRSVNKRFLVRNPYKESVKINLRISGGNNSPFRMNADGRTGKVIQELEILPRDSAWVFVEATLEPNNLNNPAIVRDSIEFETNGNRQYVQLAAYGWDAYYLHDTVFSSNTALFLADKPYVIVNSVYVDKDVTLNIGPGLHFYSSTNSILPDPPGNPLIVGALNVLGTLKVNGTKDNPVIFEGDRLGQTYTNLPGQWRGLHFWRGSTNNEIRHAVIKNAVIGIRVDSLPESGTYNLTVRNTIIKNMSGYGVLGLTAGLYFENSVIGNCGLNTFLGYYGGNYALVHCSFFTGANGRRDPHVIFNNVMRDNNNVIIRNYDLSCSVVNSIIWGPLETEVVFDVSNTPVTIIRNNIYRSKVKTFDDSNLWNKDPKFINPGSVDLKLNSDSPAKDAADPVNSPPADLEEKPRDALPDIGAYEL